MTGMPKRDVEVPTLGRATIPIPLNKDEMLELQREFKIRAKKYRSLHKHWKKTAEKVMEKIAEKSAAGGSRLLFFLETEEFDVGSDDGSIESSAEEGGLESIACENLKLFFNLTDAEEVTPAENDPSEISEEE
ncbi:uncharacterized protein LOC106638720 [Copidosoma floridanum]|uniref:uncharacterized protein LOC106638720 n=1 Tax=Copidosoma floridanum TaxID=29053 RepID=UPI0006C979DB|nr:uncharacterized protein LOC106638720 [Copidosoma floridanum]